jgi:hypothetical protein
VSRPERSFVACPSHVTTEMLEVDEDEEDPPAALRFRPPVRRFHLGASPGAIIFGWVGRGGGVVGKETYSITSLANLVFCVGVQVESLRYIL